MSHYGRNNIWLTDIYSLNLKPWSARTLYVYAHTDLAHTDLAHTDLHRRWKEWLNIELVLDIHQKRI